MSYEIVITSDRTMMSNHRGKEFLGFMATGPSIFLPEKIWMWLCCPKPKVTNDGRPIEAPYGLRKIEAKLIDSGFNAAIIDPDHLEKHLNNAKILMVGHHDFFAFGPPSSEWWLITGKEPVNRRSFIKLMELSVIKKAKKRGLKIIAGGPAAWQWLWEPELWNKWGIDVVIDGEAERVVVDVVKKILSGNSVPRYIWVSPYETPTIDEIPVIKGASVNGLVEIMRGCPRGCKFCSVTLRPLRFIPMDKIEKEILVNVKNGVVHGILHSEDVLLYGAKGVIPREEPLMRLHEMVLRYYKSLAWSHTSLAAIVVAERNNKIVSRITELIYSKCDQDYIGVEVGIETGSPKLAKLIMPSKAAPFKPEEYPQIVEEAFKIMHENKIIPAATFIIGLPEETPDDVMKTIELIERLKPYRSLIVPMFFVPMGALKASKNSVTKVKITREHVEALKVSLEHSIHWASDIMKNFYMKGPKYFLARMLLNMFIHLVKIMSKRAEKSLKEFVEKELCVK